ncbi:hypothetical protein HG536_0C01090 [Torulaspora globosa]|uniref:RNA polymerase I-specific transcription initiation factor RRN5 n=1 Tax=Torulaspora globosa TaxID=48254 RepID=A0A7G3ZEK6_9SACH|nr:uncharacterized protein HG536_0C01090 [Torulaspora globosa]QLL31942.1 hypothetical protein HG536_0C01090 [Torulaspora globosa]
MVNEKKSRDLLADYFDVFNEEVKQFLDPYASNDYELEGSHIHIDSKVSWFEDNKKTEDTASVSELESESESDDAADSYDDERYQTAEEYQEETPRRDGDNGGSMGSFWSVAEKIMFFHCLSRYSIHGLDEWRERLPSKSKFEILVYYRVLKENLNRLKTLGGSFRRILSRAELPIAYEMDEFYVSLEERMSARVRLETDTPAVDSEPDESGLISFENWNKRWMPIYSKTRAEELTPACYQPLPFSQDAMDFLTQRCIEYTRRLLTTAILTDMEKVSIPTALFRGQEEEANADDRTIVFSNPKKYFPHVVTKESIVNAVYLLRQEGFDAPTLPETILRTIKKFDLEHDEDGRLFRSKSLTASLVPSLLESFSVTGLPLSRQEAVGHPDEELDLPLIKKLYRLNGGKPPHKKRRIEQPEDHFLQDDELDRMDNPLELELCDWETQLLDAADMRESRLHQHRLIAYFTGDTTPLTVEANTTLQDIKSPIPLVPTTMIKRYMHSNT